MTSPSDDERVELSAALMFFFHGTHPDHLRDPLYQRDQASGQPRRLAAARRSLCPLLRARGHEVLFLCATDEHGTPAELAAAKAGKPVAEYCAEMWEVQAALADGFRLSFDHFGRSSPQNHALTQHFAGKLDEAGLIEEVSKSRSIPTPTAASCPTATSRAPAPIAAMTRRAATSARTAPSSSTPPT
jgi:hypothetical protein